MSRLVKIVSADWMCRISKCEKMLDSRFSNREGKVGNEHVHNVKMFIVGLSDFVRIDGSPGGGIFDGFGRLDVSEHENCHCSARNISD
jgi:hypothetical protein